MSTNTTHEEHSNMSK